MGLINSIEIKLKPGVDGDAIRDKLRAAFPPEFYSVTTWRDEQGALLMAVQTETAILNVILSIIILVAGFGILAIFYMIVMEKTRDIGVLKSLGASGRGVMGIFLAYGLLLGLVGAGAGMVGGLLFRPLHQPPGRRPGPADRAPCVQFRHLLFLQDPHDRSSADGSVDRGRGAGHRRVGQRVARLPRRPPASRGGAAL